MILLGGVYKFSPKQTGFRNDHCNHCKAQHMAEQTRTLNVVHFFFVPLVPLGHSHVWRCSVCGNDPRERTKESPTLLIIGMLLFGFVGLVGLAASVFGPKDRLMMLSVGGGMLMASLLCWFVLKLQQGDKDGTDEAVAPNRDTECPFCNGEIADGPMAQCVVCGARRY